VGVDASDGGKGEEEAAVHPVMAWAQSEGGACGMMRAVHGQSKRPRGKGGGAPTEFDWFMGRETEAARGGREIGPRRCSAGGPVTGTIRRVCAVGVKKSFFGRNTLQIAIFWYFIVLPPYPLPRTYYGWVQREG
jgi:hypothetical protein